MKIAFVGAGAVNFGGKEGPWDHASRLQKVPGVEVVAIVDPWTERASQVFICMNTSLCCRGKQVTFHESC